MEKRGLRSLNRKRTGKRGIMQLPFGMIFSIILIVVFIVVAFIAIKHFLELKKCSQIGIFYNDFQEEVNEIWSNEEKAQDSFEGSLPTSIKYVCFIDLGEKASGDSDNREKYNKAELYSGNNINLFLWLMKESCDMVKKINHLNVSSIIADTGENPYCFENKKGKVEIKIEKGYYDAMIKIVEEFS